MVYYAVSKAAVCSCLANAAVLEVVSLHSMYAGKAQIRFYVFDVRKRRLDVSFEVVQLRRVK